MHERWERTLAEFDEKALIARLRARDTQALGEVFARYGDAMTTLAASMLRNRTEADDVVEDALLRIHDAGPGFRGERGTRTWCLRIVANLCRDRLRRRKFTGDLPDEPDAFERAGLRFDPVPEWDGAMDQRVMAAALERAIEALPPDQREVVVLRHRLDLSHGEMAELLSVPEGTVKSRLARGLAVLRDAMKELGT
ncbi:MAG: RNA polymerase sigma factor [Candidatus Eisenbacteria bacterium]